MSIYLLELRNLRKSAVMGTLSLCVVIGLLLAFFPAMQTESMQALAGAKMAGLGEGVLKALGLSTLLDFSILTNFFGFAIQYMALAIMVLVVQQAAALFIKEETDGTIEYLCAKPVSRDNIVRQKLLAHVTIVLGMVLAYVLVATVGYLIVSDYSLGQALREVCTIFGAILFIALVYSAVGVLASTLLRSSKGVSGVAVGLVFGTFLLGILSVVVPKLHFLIWLSPMDWIKTDKLLREGILMQEWIVGLAVIAGSVLAAWLRYRRKDLLI